MVINFLFVGFIIKNKLYIYVKLGKMVAILHIIRSMTRQPYYKMVAILQNKLIILQFCILCTSEKDRRMWSSMTRSSWWIPYTLSLIILVLPFRYKLQNWKSLLSVHCKLIKASWGNKFFTINWCLISMMILNTESELRYCAHP